ncbi:MAG: hypothetical protein AAGF11_49655 [Myxococcota bacterium]
MNITDATMATANLCGAADLCAAAPCATAPCADPWAWFETRYDDGVVVRIARTQADADAARSLIRDAWAVDDDEPYFYGLFDDARQLFANVVEPSTRCGDLQKLDAICLMVDARDEKGRSRTVGTFSLVLDHHAKAIEVGRGAIARAWQRRGIPAKVMGPMLRLLSTLPDYAVITDASTIARGARAIADALGMATVALHPSNFTVQSRAVDYWRKRLTERRGPEIARALLRRSCKTGLGRFTTSYHCRLPRTLAPAQPVLTAAQQPFYAHTCRVSRLDGRSAQWQQPQLRETVVRERRHTATRTIVDPPLAFDVCTQVFDAADEGFETLVVQVPCDVTHRALAERLETLGAILGGVFVDTHGCWRASYTLLTSVGHDARVRRDLAALAAHDALDGDAGALLRLVVEQACSGLDNAC